MDAAAEQVVRAELERHRMGARIAIRRGLTMIASIPFVVLAAAVAAFVLGSYGAFAAITIGVVYSLGAGITGAASLTDGIAQHRRCTQELRSLEATHELPQARLLR